MDSIRLKLFVALSLLLVAGCGGGGGDDGGGGSVPSAPALPVLITASAIVDVNGDGKKDVIIGSQMDTGQDRYSSPMVLFNEGGTSFRKSTSAIPPQYLGTDGSAVVIEPADFNNDGKVDLLVAAVDIRRASFYQSARIHLYKGNGDGSFIDASADITNGAFPFTIFCGPFNRSDLWPGDLRVADLDGDGFVDFVVASGGNGCGGIVYRNDGTGKFAPVTIQLTQGAVTTNVATLVWSGGNYASDVVAGDLNNDGKVDLFAPQWNGSAHAAFINTSTPGNIRFTVIATPTKPGTPTGVERFKTAVLLDINGDTFLDVVGVPVHTGSTATFGVSALRGDGAGGFTQDFGLLSPIPAVVHSRQVLTADLSGDGKLDVLISDHGFDAGTFPGARNWLLINNGAGVLVDRTATNLDLLPGYTHQSAIGDLNGDGKPELLLNNLICNGMSTTCANQARFWLNNGAGAFTPFNPTIN